MLHPLNRNVTQFVEAAKFSLLVIKSTVVANYKDFSIQRAVRRGGGHIPDNMAPTIHLVRHAQGFHNLSRANYVLPDPLLTPTGVIQCYKLGEDFPYTKQVGLVVTSPLRRAIYTALYTFEEVLCEKELRILTLPEVQETTDLPCDTGSSVDELKQEFRGKPVDLNHLSRTWNRKDGKWSSTPERITERAKEVREWLKARKEDHIVVVTHDGFLHYLTEDWSDHKRLIGQCLDVLRTETNSSTIN